MGGISMEYTPEQLQQIEYYASIYLRVTDIAVILEIKPEELRHDINDQNCPAYLPIAKAKRSPRCSCMRRR